MHHKDDELSEKIRTTRNVNQQEPNNHNQGDSMHNYNHLNYAKALKASNRSVTNYINLLKERIQELLRTELEKSGSKLAWVYYL